MTNKIKRMWINQPSKLQQLHKLHATNVLAIKEHPERNIYRIYFLSGEVVSMDAPANTLSLGWLKQSTTIRG